MEQPIGEAFRNFLGRVVLYAKALAKWLAVEGLTLSDLEDRGCTQLVLTVAREEDGVSTLTTCYVMEDNAWHAQPGLTRMAGYTGSNGIAHDLIDRFGDFAAVLEASEEELCTVEGVGPSTARMLHLLPQISRYYGRSRTSTTRCIKTTEQMGSYLMAKFAWSDYERAMLVSLDSRKRVRAAVWLREGTSDRVSLDIKNVVAAAIKGGTDAVVLCHNHPNGVALPSLEDMDATGSIARALGLVNVHLLDHFILTDTEYFSMRDANRLPIYDFKTGTLFWP